AVPALRARRRCGGLLPLGPVPALLAPARAGRGRRDPRSPDRVVARLPGRRARRGGRRILVRPAPGPPASRAARPRRRAHHRQLGHVHPRGQLGPRRGDVAGLLHQPARVGRPRRRRPGRAAAACAGLGGRDRHARRRRPHRGLRAAAVDRTDPGLLLRALRPRQEARGHRRHAEPGRRDRAADPARARLSGVPRRLGQRDLHHGGARPRRAHRGGRHRHRRPAHALRGRGQPAAAHDARGPAVHRADHALLHRRGDQRRAHAGHPPGRLRPGVGRPRGLHRGPRAHLPRPPPAPPAGRAGARAGL
ncbi:MAG: Uncharacterized inner membrane protein RarD, partial [uncultured Solirubrobacteraceae bacterium]